MSPKEILSSLGFTDGEIAIYLATLEMGMAPASVIAKKAHLKRPTVYEILKKLCQKNIAERFLKNRIQYYSVVSPQVLFERYQKYISAFKESLPQMMAVHNRLVHKPKVSFYEGIEDVKRLYLDVLNAKDEALNYFLPGKSYEYFGRDWINNSHVKERVRRGIKLRIIMPKDTWTSDYQARQKSELREIRVIQPKHIFFTNEVYLYNNKISIFSFDEDFGLLIESQDVYDTQKALFELAWESKLLK